LLGRCDPKLYGACFDPWGTTSSQPYGKGQTAQQSPASKDNEAGEQLEPEPQPDSPPETPHPQPIQNPFDNGETPLDPLQFMQEILQRQQKIDQQQNPQNNPPE
jgi:hypothetical protein